MELKFIGAGHNWTVITERQLRRHGQPIVPAPSLDGIDSPVSIKAFLDALAPDVEMVGGGTDVQLRRRQNLSRPRRLASMAQVPDFARLDIGPGEVVIGAGVTLAELAQRVRSLIPALAETIDEIASPQIPNVATVAGNLAQAKRCWFFRNGFNCYKRRGGEAPCYAVLGDHRFYHAAIDGHRCQAVTPSDLATVLVALDAVVTIAGPNGWRNVALETFYKGPGEVDLAAGEAIVHLTIQAEAVARRTAYRKLNLWQGDFAIASSAVSVSLDAHHICRDIRIVVGAVAPVPIRLRLAEKNLLDKPLSIERLREQVDRELDKRGHPLARNEWKLDAVAGLCERAVEHLTTGDKQG